MNEIEIKARVQEKDALTERLNSFAEYLGDVIREDSYYAPKEKTGPKIRIRKETSGNCVRNLVTYKKKRGIECGNGALMEVNDEKECEISSCEALENFLIDSGYEICLKKRKEVRDWSCSIPELGKTATIELCTIPRLGDFLEIEVISDTADEDTLQKTRKHLFMILEKCGIPESAIENRYYSQLLAELDESEKQK